MSRIVVTGGAGQLGRWVVAELRAAGHEVGVLDLASPMPGERLDVLDLDAVFDALAGQEAVVHLAAIDIAVEADDERYFRTNVMGTWNVLHAAERQRLAKAVVCSSVSAFGFSDEVPAYAPAFLPVDESHACLPTHPYGLSKQVVEDIGRSFAARGRLAVVAMRPTFVVFPPLVAAVDAAARASDAGEPMPPGVTVSEGSLSALRTWVHPADAARAFRLALETDTGRYDCFLLGADDSYTPEPTLPGVERRFGARPDVRDEARYADEPRASAVSSKRAERVLGWRAQRRWREYVDEAASQATA